LHFIKENTDITTDHSMLNWYKLLSLLSPPLFPVFLPRFGAPTLLFQHPNRNNKPFQELNNRKRNWETCIWTWWSHGFTEPSANNANQTIRILIKLALIIIYHMKFQNSHTKYSTLELEYLFILGIYKSLKKKKSHSTR
jgi:hypothetical protein